MIDTTQLALTVRQTGRVTPPPIFLYDGDCAFCSSCARFIERRMRTNAHVVPWQFSDLSALGVRQDDAEEAVQWIDTRGVQAGPAAIAALLRDAGSFWRPLGAVLATRPAQWLAWPAYRLVARNRHRLPGGTAACSLSQAQRDRLKAQQVQAP